MASFVEMRPNYVDFLLLGAKAWVEKQISQLPSHPDGTPEQEAAQLYAAKCRAYVQKLELRAEDFHTTLWECHMNVELGPQYPQGDQTAQ